MLLKTPFPNKPNPLETVVDPTHPLSQNMLGYWLFGEGNTAIDLTGINNKKRTISSSSPTPERRAWGNALVLTTNQNIEFPLNVGQGPVLMTSNSPWSVSCQLLLTSTPTATGGLVNLGISGTSCFQFFMRNVAGNIACVTGDGSGASQQFISAVTISKPTALTGTGTGTNGTVTNYFVNRVRSTATNSVARALPTTNFTLTVNKTNGGSNNQAASYNYVTFWSRQLTVNEILWVQTDPYAMLIPTPKIRVWAISIAAGGGGIQSSGGASPNTNPRAQIYARFP